MIRGESAAGTSDSGGGAGTQRIELRNGWTVRSQEHWQYLCEGKLKLL